MRVNTSELVRKGADLLQEGNSAKIAKYLRRLKHENPLALAMLDMVASVLQSRLSETIKKGGSLLSKVSGDLELSEFLFNILGIAYMKMGNHSVAKDYYIRALEITEMIGKPKRTAIIKMNLFSCMMFRAEYESLSKEIQRFNTEAVPSARYNRDCILAVVELTRGMPDKAIKKLEFLDELKLPNLHWRQGMEIKGLVMRMLGRFEEATACFIALVQSYTDFASAYASFPCAKALQLSRLAGLEPPPRKLIKRCLTLAKKGGWGEQAAAQEIQALLSEDDAEAAQGLFAAAQSYQKASQPLEACLTGLTAAYLAWKTTSPVFPEALKFLAPLAPLHPGFRKDPLLGDFLTRIEPLLGPLVQSESTNGIRAYLTGELRVFVNGERLSLKGWRNNKAIMALLYLLLSPQHRIPRDHLFYLLWPRRNYGPEKNRVLLYKAIYLVRKNLKNPDLLIKKHDFYQLEEVWTDLSEIENLLRRADATYDPAEKKELLSRTRELAKDELLPDFPYDRHIDEYRQYYERLRKRLMAD